MADEPTTPQNIAPSAGAPRSRPPATIPALTLTADQIQYLVELREKETKYDPTAVIGGTKVQSRQ